MCFYSSFPSSHFSLPTYYVTARPIPLYLVYLYFYLPDRAYIASFVCRKKEKKEFLTIDRTTNRTLVATT
ncbi:hypothetical protein P167DRAFT_531051 [Morchella conica CCBAS932]|uniref:Uncharacterized protein n=1 Tax=Morchella conica CCBAS932 TaxID=1392247 RepID=A0A3N4L3J9_9PEZI|nr:hypothetical protein P167DRAFT_531051 [Morchella conica CCBAS932]